MPALTQRLRDLSGREIEDVGHRRAAATWLRRALDRTEQQPVAVRAELGLRAIAQPFRYAFERSCGYIQNIDPLADPVHKADAFNAEARLGDAVQARRGRLNVHDRCRQPRAIWRPCQRRLRHPAGDRHVSRHTLREIVDADARRPAVDPDIGELATIG